MVTHRIDSDIQKDIVAELKWDPSVLETDIGVMVKHGAVTLAGTVPNYSQKSAAERAAKRIKGVRAVANEIDVKLPYQTEGTDKGIAEHIARMFEWNSQIAGDNLKADVKNGFVTLSGNVNWRYQRDYVQRQVENIKGVRAVINSISIRSQASLPDIRNQIVNALQRHASLEASHVKVSVADGTVTLSGNVDSYFEKELIEDAVWSAPGVSRVIDNLHIAPSFSEAA